ncbi:YfhD family protein [Paenibacillus piri]|uniref:YfhD family protein n=2 Tax=Paenibacillus piri TaxID=2547395 RepID=A0A4R5KMH6_9BACL|nr:YfhD family protein [Paenibacillus piri]
MRQQFNAEQQDETDGKYEDVQFNAELADEDDLEAVARANEAAARQEQS